MSTMFQQAVMTVEAPQPFAVVRAAIETSFSSGKVAAFLRSLERSSLRIRDFETVLRQKMLGEQAVAQYAILGNSDQGQIREFYLASLEQVDPELRQKFFKLYAYY